MTDIQAPEFCEGIRYFGSRSPEFDRYAAAPVIASGQRSIPDPGDPAAAYQVLLAADALRLLTLQMAASKGSGHPGGYASSAEAHAALMMLGHTNIFTEVGHHAPGFYAALFLDTSLETMGISTVIDVMNRYRERDGLLGHLSGAIPGVLAPAGPLGQGQHFAMAAAYLHPDTLFPVTIGDGGMGEPYVLSGMMHFHTAFPMVTNYLPVMIWNGHSQEHHSMVSLLSNAQMIDHWKAHGFDEVILVDAVEFEPGPGSDAFADSTRFPLENRLAFASATLQGLDRAARSALGGRLTAFVIKQLKGAGMHVTGAASHNLYPKDSLADEAIQGALQRLALPPEGWQVVRDNLLRAGGGPAAETAVTEQPWSEPPPVQLKLDEHELGAATVPSTAVGELIAQVGDADPGFVVTSSDGTAASAMAKVIDSLGIRHPTADAQYRQGPTGRLYEPISEDACAGLAASLALLGSRSAWLSYGAFAVNGWPIAQTATQAMAELRRRTPSVVAVFTATALEQGRNGWTHQRPEIEAYIAAMIRNGNIFPLFPCDANVAQAAYEHAIESHNKGFVLFISKSPVPVRLGIDAAREAVRSGAAVLFDSPGRAESETVVFAVAGDMILAPVFDAARRLTDSGRGVRIVAVVSPRRLFTPREVAWDSVSEPDGEFMDEARFASLFSADVLVGVTGGSSAPLEPVLVRSSAARRYVVGWQRGETTAGTEDLMDLNGMSAESLVRLVQGDHADLRGVLPVGQSGG